MENKSQKIYLTYSSLLRAQDLWQAHYQVLSIIFLKEWIELNENSIKNKKNDKKWDKKQKNVELCIIRYKDWLFFEYTNVKDDLIE